MTYCLGIATNEGLVLASDSRTNAGFDQVNTCRKMFQFVQPGERVFVILTSGSLSISQSVISLLRDDFDAGRGLAASCVRVTSAADLVLDVTQLGAAYLGGTRLGTLAEAGLVTELRPGAVRQLSAAMSWDPAPWCPTVF